jgi:ubiquinone/menaquinone biosynthesis C-methylase UbiE
MTKTTKVHRQTAESYDDPKHNYAEYWKGREYEHAAEEAAITKLIGAKRFDKAVDVGGGFGRLSKFLTRFCDDVTLAEPSQQQLDIAKDFLKDVKHVSAVKAQASDLPYKDASVDLVLVVRVLHHIPDPTPEFKEISRALKPGGSFVLEFANNNHFLNRVRYSLKGKKVPKDPVDIRTGANRSEEEIAFVNHHPETIVKQLAKEGLVVKRVLSGSNLRSSTLKRLIPDGVLITLEKPLQSLLAKSYFGPSTWLLLEKTK